MSWLSRSNLRASIRKKISSAVGNTNLYQDSGGGGNETNQNGISNKYNGRPDSFEDFCKNIQICYEIVGNTETSSGCPASKGYTSTVLRCLVSLISSLASELKQSSSTQCFDMVIGTDIIGKIVLWSQASGEYVPELRVELLKSYETLLVAAGAKHDSTPSEPVGRESALLLQPSILTPLLTLLHTCSENGQLLEVEKRLVSLLNLLVVAVIRDPGLLDCFFEPATPQTKPGFIIFELLVPFVHREGLIGQQARDSLILCLSLANERSYIGYYIAEHSNFNPVLATGLSGLYSALPRQLSEGVEDRGWLSTEDINSIPELSSFVASLEFCSSALMSCSDPISEQLIEYVYQGFLIPVMGPALHQNTVREITAATCYFNLCLKRIANRALLGAFLRFLAVEKYEGQCVMDSLVMRIMAKSKALCLATLTLLHTLVSLHCEDIMLFLVFRGLLSGRHLLIAENNQMKTSLIHSAEKFLSLIPKVQNQEAEPALDATEYYTPNASPIKDLNLTSNVDETKESIVESSPTRTNKTKDTIVNAILSTPSIARKLYQDATSTPVNGLKPPDEAEIHQFHCYLLEARSRICGTIKATQYWTYRYDWRNPTISEAKKMLRERLATPKRRKLSVALPKEEKANSDSQKEQNSDREFFEDPIIQIKSDGLYQDAVEQLTHILQEMNIRSPAESSGYESLNFRSEPFSLDLDSNFVSDNLQQQLEFWSMMREDSEEAPVERKDDEDLIEEGEDEIQIEPDIGNFLVLLLYRVDSWLTNDLSINLIVTSVLSCLATHTQPALRDFLLDTKLVTQPSVTTLPQILAAVKHRLEAILSTRKNVDSVIEEAKLELSTTKKTTLPRESLPISTVHKAAEKKKSFASALQSIFRRNTTGSPVIEADIPESILEGVQGGNEPKNHSRSKSSVPEESEDMLYYRHVAKCAVLFEEWLKELAALSLEHNIAISDMHFPKFA
ncbi:FHF complex subunit HOOK-interacting protein 1B-like isoform X2 [Artemia franciscana]|uniref:FHF complex subunit HOOK-interacting protein C-terminal domain-containing protein n=1 Tax=Artemia franciscana TaxID=6661 RepID=A0AA88L7J4_ARTSF|nr:hypothetical protein QYM36_010480 [Artemia franciscana]KAK2715920.1 hypothetical protein QYM36_010480 [Artemia franciscana]